MVNDINQLAAEKKLLIENTKQELIKLESGELDEKINNQCKEEFKKQENTKKDKIILKENEKK